jgi:hypothetical protein
MDTVGDVFRHKLLKLQYYPVQFSVQYGRLKAHRMFVSAFLAAVFVPIAGRSP